MRKKYCAQGRHQICLCSCWHTFYVNTILHISYFPWYTYATHHIFIQKVELLFIQNDWMKCSEMNVSTQSLALLFFVCYKPCIIFSITSLEVKTDLLIWSLCYIIFMYAYMCVTSCDQFLSLWPIKNQGLFGGAGGGQAGGGPMFKFNAILPLLPLPPLPLPGRESNNCLGMSSGGLEFIEVVNCIGIIFTKDVTSLTIIVNVKLTRKMNVQ